MAATGRPEAESDLFSRSRSVTPEREPGRAGCPTGQRRRAPGGGLRGVLLREPVPGRHPGLWPDRDGTGVPLPMAVTIAIASVATGWPIARTGAPVSDLG